MSVYSATPAPPARIRIVSHPPLASLRAWLPLPTFSTSTNEPATIQDLVGTIKGMLRTDKELEIELQGFALFGNSPLSMLDPSNDILDIKLSQPLRPSLPDSKPHRAKIPAPTLAPTSVPLPASSSSAASSSSSSSDSSSDSEPEVLPSKRPLSNGAKTISPRPAKRRKHETRASPSDTSDETSSSSSSSSDSSSDSDSSEDSAPPSRQAKPVAAPILSTPNATTTAPVVPGSGSKRTHKRNQRKRTLRMAKARERNQASEGTGVETETSDKGKKSTAPEETKSAVVDRQRNAPPKGEKGEKDEEKMETDTPQPIPSQPSSRPKNLPDPYSDYSPSVPSLPPPQQRQVTDLPPPPTLLRNGSEPGVSLVGPGRRNLPPSTLTPKQTRNPYDTPDESSTSNKKKNKRKNKKKFEEEGTQEVPLATAGNRRASPSYTPASPNYTPSIPLGNPETATTASSFISLTATRPEEEQEQEQVPKPTQPPIRFPYPNKRTDLPPWMVVTSVNVEQRGWEAGVGKRFRGTSKTWEGWNGNASTPSVVVVEGSETKAVGVPEEVGWETWKSREQVESEWDRLRKLESPQHAKEGMRIAVKVLELDPTTFNPTLSLKYGRLLASISESTLRIQLHPSCLPFAGEEPEEEWYGQEEEDDEDYSLKRKMKFGEDAFNSEVEGGDSGVWEGEWTGDVRLVQ